MKVYELIENLQEMPQLADIKIVFDCGFASRDIESIYIDYDCGPIVCVDEGKYTRIGILDG